MVVARPLPASVKPAQFSVIWVLAAVGVRVPLVGAVWSRRMEAAAMVETLPAASLYQRSEERRAAKERRARTKKHVHRKIRRRKVAVNKGDARMLGLRPRT